MKNIKNWEKFNESYNQEVINEGLLGDLIKLPLKIVGFLLKPLVPLLLKVIGKTITVENKWKVIQSILNNVVKLAFDIERAKEKLDKEDSNLTPNEKRELEKKVEKFKKEYPNGFKFSEVKKKLIESVEKNFAKATDEKKKEDLEWLLKKISEYKIVKTSGRYNVEILDDLIVESLNEGRTEKASKSKDSEVKVDEFRTTIKNFLKGKDCKVKQVGDDFEIHCDEKHVAQVMFRKDLVTVKKVGVKFGKDFKYNELGKIKSEISNVIK